MSEIGLKSESTSRASEDFGIGMTFANLHWVGTKPSRIEALKINASGRDKEEAFSRRNQDIISSGSAAEWGVQASGGKGFSTVTNLSLNRLVRAESV